MRDINRTFPAHDFFKEDGGAGQDSLFKISKVPSEKYIVCKHVRTYFRQLVM